MTGVPSDDIHKGGVPLPLHSSSDSASMDHQCRDKRHTEAYILPQHQPRLHIPVTPSTHAEVTVWELHAIPGAQHPATPFTVTQVYLQTAFGKNQIFGHDQEFDKINLDTYVGGQQPSPQHA